MTQSPPVIVRGGPDPNEPEAIEFYRILGMCVSDWAFVDRRLYQIFHHALKMNERQSAFIYYRQRSFNQRLRLVDDAAKSYLAKENYETHWKPLHTTSNDLSHTRNLFSHHPVKRIDTSREGKPLCVYQIYVEPYERILNNEYPGLKGKSELDVDDLKQHNLDVMKLERALRHFLAGTHFNSGS